MFFGLRKEPKMVENGEDKSNKGLEGTGLVLPINRHSNLKSASSDDDFTQILTNIKSSKTPVTNHCYPLYFLGFHFTVVENVYLIVLLHYCLQAVINYGASWYVTTFPSLMSCLN